MAQTPPTLTPLPEGPNSLNKLTFAKIADKFLVALILFRTQLVALATNMYNNALEAFNSAATATAQAQAAAAIVAAQAFVSGKVYVKGDAAYSNLDQRTYRRQVAGSGTADPSVDPVTWRCVTPSPVPQIQVITTSGPWVVPASEFELVLVGGGQAGSDTAAANDGGSSAGTVIKRFSGAQVGAIATVVIGSPGTGSTGAGGDSSFTLAGFTSLVAGSGGGANSGIAQGGDLNISGQRGYRRTVVANNSYGGAGGSSAFGFGGTRGAGSGYGSGGVGGTYIEGALNQSASPGQPGVMIARY